MHFADTVWGILQLLLLLWLGVIAWMRDTRRAHQPQSLGSRATILFCCSSSPASSSTCRSLSFGQHLSLRYGLSVQSWPSWFGDQAKSFAISWLIGGLLVMLLFWIIRSVPAALVARLLGCTIPITLVGVFLTPYVIDPLFNKFEPLQKSNPELVAQLEKVVARGHMNIPPERMFLMKARPRSPPSTPTSQASARSKRVVVWDTSLQKGTPDEILFIFGHESGHYVLGHVLRGLFLSFVGSFILLYSGLSLRPLGHPPLRPALAHPVRSRTGPPSPSSCSPSRSSAPSSSRSPTPSAAPRSTPPTSTAKKPSTASSPTRRRAAKSAFDVLGENSLDDPNPSPFVEFWTYNHPATGRRAAFGKAYNPWAPGFAPKYFNGRQ